MDRLRLQDRYTLAERQAVLHGFALSPLTAGQFKVRVREILAPSAAIQLLGKLECDEVVMRGPCPGMDVPVFAVIGSLLQPAPFAPITTPPSQ